MGNVEGKRKSAGLLAGSTHILISRNTYAIGTYDEQAVKFHPNPKVGIFHL
jgi:hypothetical protein